MGPLTAKRISIASFVVLAATLGIARPAPGLPGAYWADLAAAVAAGAFVFGVIRGRLGLFAPLDVILPMVAYVGLAALSAVHVGSGFLKVLGLAELATVLLLATNLGMERQNRDRILRAWICGTAFLAALALAGSMLDLAGIKTALSDERGGDLGFTFRPMGLCTTIDMLASVCVAPLLILIHDGARLFSRRARHGLLLLSGLALALSCSRSVLAFGVGLLALGKRWPRVRLSVGAALVIAALASARLDLYRDSRGVIISLDQGLRWREARAAFETFLANPWRGIGPDALPAFVPWPRPGDPLTKMAAHSTALDVAAHYGFPGLVAFVFLLVAVGKRAWRTTNSDLGMALRAALIAALVDMLTIDSENFRHLWLLLGLIVALQLEEEKAGRSAVAEPEPLGAGA